MCGIAGFLDHDNSLTQADMLALVGTMADKLSHRGPDDHGSWADAACGIALGHRRLSIIDLSPAGHQPMLSASGRFVIAFNGEIYNYLDVLEELRSAEGHELSLRGHSDTEVILACFERWGVEKSLPRLQGMFAIAAWDRTDRALWLLRDRFGKKPLYYGTFGKTTMFGSELKALRLHPGLVAELDRDAVAAYLRFNCIPAPLSIYRGIRKLPAASWLRISYDGMTDGPHSYWSMGELARSSMKAPFPGTNDEAAAELERLLRLAIRSRMLASDVPVGLFLSGGVDSSTVTALAQAQSTIPIRTFSIGMTAQTYDESKFARAVASHLGTDHTEWILSGQEAMSTVSELPSVYDEPFADASGIPTLLVSRLARKHVTVALSGDGGDEMFGGYNRHIMAASTWPVLARIPRGLRTQVASTLGWVAPGKWEGMLNLAASGVPRQFRFANLSDKIHKIQRAMGARDSRDLYLRLISNWGVPPNLIHANGSGSAMPLCAEDWLSEQHPAQSMMLADALGYMQDDILVKVDRASMATSLEVRNPFLDLGVVEFAWSLPLHFKVRDGVGKWIVRRVMDKHIPRELTDRPKMGFAIPLGDWLRGPLRNWAESLLSPDELTARGILNSAVVRSLWTEFLAGRRDLTEMIWGLLMLQGWIVSQK
jgi:asparagine synthase (glutamine-hydrolysing)